jgi:hypothetical protein
VELAVQLVNCVCQKPLQRNYKETPENYRRNGSKILMVWRPFKFRQKFLGFCRNSAAEQVRGTVTGGQLLQIISLNTAGKSAGFMPPNSLFNYVWWYLMML